MGQNHDFFIKKDILNHNFPYKATAFVNICGNFVRK